MPSIEHYVQKMKKKKFVQIDVSSVLLRLVGRSRAFVEFGEFKCVLVFACVCVYIFNGVIYARTCW